MANFTHKDADRVASEAAESAQQVVFDRYKGRMDVLAYQVDGEAQEAYNAAYYFVYDELMS